MSNIQDNVISLQIHQSQLDSLYSAFLNSFFENNAKQMVDLLYRTIQVPFRQKDEQLVILILDKRRQGIITALLIKNSFWEQYPIH